jgi:hypothetical protein
VFIGSNKQEIAGYRSQLEIPKNMAGLRQTVTISDKLSIVDVATFHQLALYPPFSYLC